MKDGPESFLIEPIPRGRRFAADAGYLGRRTHIIHGLLEIDVSEARSRIRLHRENTGESLSFTAFIIFCLGRAVQNNPHLHAYRDWRNRLVIFENVNISCMVEVDLNGRKVALPHIFKAANLRSFRELHDEMRETQAGLLQSAEGRATGRLLALPAFLRRLIYRVVLRFPHSLRSHSSPVMVTAVGMFGHGGSAWGIPMASFTLTVTLGSISKKPGVVDDQIAIRDYLNVTVSIDHDIVDGAPAARFVAELTELIEGACGLPQKPGFSELELANT